MYIYEIDRQGWLGALGSTSDS